MKANLKLVINTQSSVLPENVFQQSESILDLVPNRQSSNQQSNPDKVLNAKPSYLLLIAVVLAHVAGMFWLINHKTTPPVIKPAAPMMVSLVSNPVPEPEVVPIVPAPQPVIKPVVKQKPIVKQKVPTPEPVAEEPVAEPVSVAETPPGPVAPPVEAKAPVVAEAPKVEPQPEPVIEPPKFGVAYLQNPAPNYPASSRRAGEEGRVLLRVLVTANGSAETVDLENSSGFEKLDEAAIKAVKKWRFVPAKRSNQAISAYVLVPVKFSLES